MDSVTDGVPQRSVLSPLLFLIYKMIFMHHLQFSTLSFLSMTQILSFILSYLIFLNHFNWRSSYFHYGTRQVSAWFLPTRLSLGHCKKLTSLFFILTKNLPMMSTLKLLISLSVMLLLLNFLVLLLAVMWIGSQETNLCYLHIYDGSTN